MAASENRKNAVLRTSQLVQYDDDDDNDDKVNVQSDDMASMRDSRGLVGMNDGARINASNAHLVGQEGIGGIARTDRVDEGYRGYQHDGVDGGARADVYMEIGYREDMVAQQAHTGAEGSDMASEAMKVFCSYDTVAATGHAEEMIPSSTPGGNEYSEEDLQERGVEESALEERVHGDPSEGYMPEEAGMGEGHSSFSGVQQLQLRAQILVYGDLIKGVLPDETMMSSAFADAIEGAEPDRSSGGWNWEVPWQLAVEKEAERQRLAEEDNINKGDVIMSEGDLVDTAADNLEPGTPSTSPIRVAEDSLREEDITGTMAQTGVTDNPSLGGLDEQTADLNGVAAGLAVNLDAVVDSIVATTGSPIDLSLFKDSAGKTQVTRSPSLDPWLDPTSGQVPSAPGAQAWQTPVPIPNVGLGSQVAMVNTPSGTAKPDVGGGVAANIASTPGNVEEKGSRKRKSRARERKTPAPKSTGPTPRRSRAKSASAGKAAMEASTPNADPRTGTATVPSRLMYESSDAAVVMKGASPASPAGGKVREAQGRSNLHAETQSWLEQAKASFEEAASAANSAAEQEQLVNSVAATPRSGKEAQLTSAAAAVNAAAAVAKAAAEAAKVAYEAAVQAATMMVSDGMDSGLGKGVMGNGDKDGPAGRRSAIAAAKEEARKRATATPSMKTTPQSTDAVLRAARLMVEAASQAGAVLAKGNSLTPLTVPGSPVSQLDFRKSGGRLGRPRRENATVKSPEPSKPVETDPLKNIKGSMKKGARNRGKELQELAAGNTPARKVNGALGKLSPERSGRRQLDEAMATASTATEPPEVLHQSQIVLGSVVEVMNDEEGLRGGWFVARVLQLRTGEAYVQYDELLTDDGLTKLEEWFPLEGPLDGTERGRPRIRVISPNNMARDEGRRKRRRTTTGQRVWILGDRVDAFVQDGWWEGVVKAIDENDETKITVNFPGEGDTSVVKSWNLRPSFIWKDGRWEQWIRDPVAQIREDDGHHSKRLRVSESPKVQARKSGRGKSILGDKVPEETPEGLRASTRSKSIDTPSDNPVSPSLTTRISPRQKIPPKRKDGPIEVSTPTQAPSPVRTRTRSILEDEINPVKEPLTRSTPSRTKSPLRADVTKTDNLSKELRSLLGNSEPRPEKILPTIRQFAEDVAKPVTRRSARL